jgi:hypothetical protein
MTNIQGEKSVQHSSSSSSRTGEYTWSHQQQGRLHRHRGEGAFAHIAVHLLPHLETGQEAGRHAGSGPAEGGLIGNLGHAEFNLLTDEVGFSERVGGETT